MREGNFGDSALKNAVTWYLYVVSEVPRDNKKLTTCLYHSLFLDVDTIGIVSGYIIEIFVLKSC